MRRGFRFSGFSPALVWQRPPLIATLLALAGVFVLLGLGTWQAQKYALKSQALAGDSALCAQAIPQSADFNDMDADAARLCAADITLSGVWAADIQIPVGPRTHEGAVGYHIYMPLRGEDGTVILVNTGWQEGKAAKRVAQDSGRASVRGYLGKPSRPNRFTPENAPQRGEWFTLKPDEIRAQFPALARAGLSDYVLFAQSMTPEGAIADFQPAELSRGYLTPSMHLQYAAFWYALALALALVFVLRFALRWPAQTAPAVCVVPAPEAATGAEPDA